MRRGAKPGKAKVVAKRPRPRTPPKDEASKHHDLEKRLAESLEREKAKDRALTEALEQQTATSEILRVISSSPGDIQPVFDAIAANAARLCDAVNGLVIRFDGQLLHLAAHHNVDPARLAAVRQAYPRPPSRGALSGRAILTRAVVHVPDVSKDPEYTLPAATTIGYRSVLAVPMMHEGVARGTILVARDVVAPFSDTHIALIQTFAAQAVIAIENVRLFTETKEALEQQTATAEILRVISRSPTDIQPVLDALAESAARLCESFDSAIFRQDGERLLLAAHHGPIPIARTLPLVRGSVNGRAVLDGQTVHIADLQAKADEFPEGSALTRREGVHAHLSVPLMREGVAIGTINLRRTETQLFTERQVALLQTFADQAVIAIENVRLFTELQARNREVTEALDQKTATSEILRVIASSPTDLQPVFDTIAERAMQLCNAAFGAVHMFDGTLIHINALANWNPEGADAVRRAFPMAPSRASMTGRVILTGDAVEIPDVHADPEYHLSDLAQAARYRSSLGVPMLHRERAIGVVVVGRPESGRFPEEQIQLLKTFADQAVIAIENVRLFTELQEKNRALTQAHAQVTETLDQQTATSEVLRVIAGSPTDLQPVLDTLVESAGRLCQAADTFLLLIEGDQLRVAALHGAVDDGARLSNAIHRGWVAGRAVVDARTVHVEDLANAEAEFPLGAAIAARFGHRTALAIPLLRKGVPIGALFLRRREVRQFSDKEIALLETFADQAVIAIENVRLFTELEGRNRDLTATSEILRVISSSPTDVQPVFDTIVRSAVRLCDGLFSALHQFDGELLHLVAHHNYSPEALEEVRRLYPARPSRGQGFGRAILERELVHLPDVEVDPEYQAQALSRAIGFRSGLFVPMLREGVPIGAIMVARAIPGPFSDNEIELLKTFADQAVIAVENVRLFTELQASNRDLTTALDQQTATSDILRVISQSQTDVQPVFDAILASAIRLLTGFTGALTRLEGDQIMLVALTSTDDASDAAVRAAFPQWLHAGGAHPQTARGRVPLNVTDAHSDARLMGPEGTYAKVRGYQSLVVVPLLRHDEAIGTLSVTRREPGGFTDDEIALLKTFADQAVIAIENVRLFTELEGRNRDLTATAEILRVISSSPTDVQPVFDTIVQAARALCGADSAAALSYDGEQLQIESLDNPNRARADALRQVYPMPATRGHATGRAILTGRPVHIADVREDPEYALDALRDTVDLRSVASVPMVRDGVPIGAITVEWWTTPRSFSDKQISLLQTFADQAVIAIENVRLFNELQASNRDLTTALDTQTATSDILRVISRSQTDVQPVFDAIVASAVRLLRGYSGTLTRLVGDQIELVALTSTDDSGDAALRAAYPQPLQSEGTAAQAMRDRATLNIADAHTDPRVSEAQRAYVRVRDYRSWAVVPLLRPDEAVGTISVTRRGPGGFSDDEIALLKTFADQAVIAIENARLLSELQQKNDALTQAHAQVSEALEQQTATAEILRVISRSPTDVQPVFEAIVASAVRLLEGYSGSLTRVVGDQLQLAALTSTDAAGDASLRALFPSLLSSEGPQQQAIRDRAPLNMADAHTDPLMPEAGRASARIRGVRSFVVVPMLLHDQAIGAIGVTRREPGGFTDDEIALLQTFADQAVIAIENVRLFKELEARTADLTRSVEQLTALGEVGRAVSSTLDLETVLTTIVSRAVELSRLDGGVVFEYEEATEEFVHRAATETGGALAEARRATRVQKGEGVVGRTAITLEPVQVPDITMPGAHESRLRENLIESGVRAILAVPMVREGRLIGSLVVSRNQPGDFPTETIELLRTFATQSALAIQNARLFHEIADKSRQLEAASRHKSEFLANMSHELRTPLNAIIGFSEVLVDRMFGELTEKQDEYLKDIYASGQHLLSLINDILDLSKIEAGRMELELSEFDLPNAIENALILVRERATRRGITLGRTIDERLGTLRGDERKVKQVLLNLLSNALKFTPEGGRIDVSARVNNGVAEIAVADTGVGIAPEDQEAVFEEFRQVGTADKKVEGTGLGLALSRKFIELHGGRIWVTSQVGHGSTFTFTLPVRRED